MAKNLISVMTAEGARDFSKMNEEERNALFLIMASDAIRGANRILVAEGKPQIGDPAFHVDPAYVMRKEE